MRQGVVFTGFNNRGCSSSLLIDERKRETIYDNNTLTALKVVNVEIECCSSHVLWSQISRQGPKMDRILWTLASIVIPVDGETHKTLHKKVW